MSNDHLQLRWKEIVEDVNSYAVLLIRSSSEPARQHISNVTRQFVALSTPISEDEMEIRRIQRVGMMLIVGALVYGDQVATAEPAAKKEIDKSLKPMAYVSLPTTQKQLDAVRLEASHFVKRLSTISREALKLTTQQNVAPTFSVGEILAAMSIVGAALGAFLAFGWFGLMAALLAFGMLICVYGSRTNREWLFVFGAMVCVAGVVAFTTWLGHR